MRKNENGRDFVNENSQNFTGGNIQNCTRNTDCHSLCCHNNLCADTVTICNTQNGITQNQIFCIMGGGMFILMLIILYIWFISKKQGIKNTGGYMGKHTYLARQTHISVERLIMPTMKLKKHNKKAKIQGNSLV